MNKICTSLEQSERLVKLGIDISTADMHYSRVKDEEYDWIPLLSPIPKLCAEYIENIPAWSLTALLGLMPLGIYDEDNYSYELKIDMIDKMPRFVRLEDCYHSDFPYDFGKDNLLDNIVESIIWLKENGKI